MPLNFSARPGTNRTLPAVRSRPTTSCLKEMTLTPDTHIVGVRGQRHRPALRRTAIRAGYGRRVRSPVRSRGVPIRYRFTSIT